MGEYRLVLRGVDGHDVTPHRVGHLTEMVLEAFKVCELRASRGEVAVYVVVDGDVDVAVLERRAQDISTRWKVSVGESVLPRPGFEVVQQQGLKDLDEAKRFCTAWIDDAVRFARNEEYWRGRALKAEAELKVASQPAPAL